MAALVAVLAWAAPSEVKPWVAGTGAVLLAVFLVVSLYRHRQIRRLAEEIDEVLHSGRTVDFSNCREGDVAVLANELSKMVSRLSRTRDQLSRERNALADSLADVSHQIRTPLTAITLMLPVVERADDARERKRAVRELESMIERVSWLVTTLLKIANGLLTPSSGQLLIDGKAPGPDTRRLVSYLPERTYLSDWMTVVQLLDFFCDFYPDFDREAAEHMLTALEISPTQRIKQMSKGTREKVQLILVMSRRTRLYLLDEPIGGVDPATRDYIIHTILTNFNPDSTLLISTHLIADVERILDDVVFISRGQLVLHQSVDQIRQERGCSVDDLFREVFRYAE